MGQLTKEQSRRAKHPTLEELRDGLNGVYGNVIASGHAGKQKHLHYKVVIHDGSAVLRWVISDGDGFTTERDSFASATRLYHSL